MDTQTIHKDMIVEDVFDKWPPTVKIFIKNRMACVGCPMARFTTVADAATIYDLSLPTFLHELADAINFTEEAHKDKNHSRSA